MSIKKQPNITPEDMTNIKLLPCPCCGGRARIHKGIYRYFNFVAVICTECGLKTADQPTPEAAVDKWNTRKHIDDLVENINSFGGCDAQDEYSRGWDDAIGVAAQRIIDYFGGGENESDNRCNRA